MRRKITNAAIALLTLGFAACSQEEDFAPQIDSDAVRISATIANLATRVTYGDEGATDFVSDDEILVVNTHSAEAAADSENHAVFAYDGTNWTATSGKLLWEEKTTNTFEAYYPATLDYTLPTDQSTPDKLAAADRMEARAEADFDTKVPFTFNHVMAKVTFKVYIASEFDTTDEFTNLYVMTKDNSTPEVTAYCVATDSDVSYNYKCSAYIPAGTYTVGEPFVKIDIGEFTGDKMLKANMSDKNILTLTAGIHYTFTLTVGKEKLTLKDTITDNLPGGWNNDSEVDLK